MRSILIHADDSAANAVRLQTALDLARAANGHVMLHVNTPFQRFIALDPFGGVFLAADAVREAEQRETALVEKLAQQLGQEDVSWNIETSSSEWVDALVSSARLADLVIVTLNLRNADHPASNAGQVGALALALHSPLLALPSTHQRFAVEGRAMLCWDGGHESANALRAAVPLLTRAAQVDVVTVAEKRGGFPSTDALRYLSSYGVHAELVERERGLETVEEALEHTAVERGADWLVMGAYGHSRLRETLFGGVTRYFLDTAKFPLLLVH